MPDQVAEVEMQTLAASDPSEVPSSFLLLVVMPGTPSSFLLLCKLKTLLSW